MKNNKLIQESILKLKRLVYGRRGEPYSFGGQSLRFSPGTRPVRTKYRTSPNACARNDALQVELVGSMLSAGDTAFDIGAHAGQYGVLMSARCGPSGQVVCFEPDPDAIACLERNFSLNGMLKAPILVSKACSDTNGTAEFYTQGGNSQSSLSREAIPKNRETKVIQIPTVRLDDWFEENQTDLPSFIKIDTEGAEINVLRGMPKLLESDAQIVCELHPYAWEDFGVTLKDLKDIAKHTGRSINWLDGRGELKDHVEYGTVLINRERPV